MKAELQQILGKAAKKLKTARIDFENGRYDESITRSYYAIFRAISAALPHKGLAFSSHSKVRRYG